MYPYIKNVHQSDCKWVTKILGTCGMSITTFKAYWLRSASSTPKADLESC